MTPNDATAGRSRDGKARGWRLIRAATANTAASMSGSGTRARAASSCRHRPTASTTTASASRACTVGMPSALSWLAAELRQTAVMKGIPLSPNLQARTFPGRNNTHSIALQSTPILRQQYVLCRCRKSRCSGLLHPLIVRRLGECNHRSMLRERIFFGACAVRAAPRAASASIAVARGATGVAPAPAWSAHLLLMMRHPMPPQRAPANPADGAGGKKFPTVRSAIGPQWADHLTSACAVHPQGGRHAAPTRRTCLIATGKSALLHISSNAMTH